MDLTNLRWTLIRTVVNTSLYIRRSAWWSPQTQPNFTKIYPCRPALFPARIFMSASHDKQQRLPLVIRVHGGGFILNNPSADDPFARHLADHAHCCVVSIDYSKAPQNKFPIAYEDVIAQAQAIIQDPDLPIDRSRVILCGASAGGNLVFGTAQDSRLRSKLLGVIGVYPLLDVVPDGAAKMATRPDPSIPDFLGDTYDGIKPLYLDSEHPTEMTDTRLSPKYFVARKDLPPNVLLFGVEHDMLCHEAEEMADKLAASAGEDKVPTKRGWRVSGVQWHKLPSQTHGFDFFPLKEVEKEKARVAAVDEMYSILCDWVKEVCKSEEGKGQSS